MAPSEAEEKWARLDDHLRARLREDLYGRWFRSLRPVALDGERLAVAAPDKFHRDFVDDNYRHWFDEEVIPGVLGERLRIQFVVDDAPRLPSPAASAQPSIAPPPVVTPAAEADAFSRDARPNPRYTFETFVVGESNRFAVAAAQAVAAKPGKNWNPLFLHGSSGLGKTHLLHAIAHAIPLATPGARVAIVSSERYTNDFVDALSKGTMADFRKKYRECGALLVDDVQFFAGREKTAEEFFHTFNALYEQNIQIVLSSDRSPKELKGLEDRLCSRFGWGMRVQIDTPEFETRAAILKKKAEVEAIELPDLVAELLATHIRSNVRELEGALMRLAAFASLKAEKITEALARDVLSDHIPPPGYKPSIEKIQEAVALKNGLTVAKLTSPSREQKIALPRQIAMFLCRELAKDTYQTIAEKFNKKDHTTVIAAVQKVSELYDTDSAVRASIDELRTVLGGS
ncbi:chromosomal replication initiator protein DnaA [Anaeromyxobacter paludicola]|uniref:Chromosomal replication initiator protein DnaA n=1 Tax=Anaeromyxobacter paludicola TaxID=2918171 RepID=A0ABM7XD10_9BACT|nr:chromosomal replication initiator protein DnaA [Anaeromyxobacter paludicola]BDG09720.1 chromosomal replication initiator protein DnaA [Anaeromyxobacter paludicola]